MYSIYVHTTPDGRKYVGSTSLKPKRRFHGGSLYRNHIRFYNAIKFFGWDNIQHEIIETVEDKETALKREEYYTLLWRTNEPEFGYNICYGNRGFHAKKTEESKRKMSEAHKGFRHTEESKMKMSESRKGNPCPTKGMHRVYNEDGSFHFEKN